MRTFKIYELMNRVSNDIGFGLVDVLVQHGWPVPGVGWLNKPVRYRFMGITEHQVRHAWKMKACGGIVTGFVPRNDQPALCGDCLGTGKKSASPDDKGVPCRYCHGKGMLT